MRIPGINKELARMKLTDTETWTVDCYQAESTEVLRTRDPERMTLVAEGETEERAHQWVMGKLDF